jgi:hypothetical protein
MNIRSPWPAAGVVLGTLLVCFFGVRAELTLAHQSEAQRGPHLATPTTADLACGTGLGAGPAGCAVRSDYAGH